MPFTPINPAAYNTQKFAYGDLLKNAMEGYELARKPKQIAQEEKQRDLTARLTEEQGTHAQQQNQYYPQIQENTLTKGGLDIDLAKFNLANRPKEIEQQELANRLKEDESRLRRKKLEAEISWMGPLNKSRIAKNEQVNSGGASKEARIIWNSYPNSAKENILALGNGLGIRPDVIINGITSGKKFEDIAGENGYDSKEIAKVIPKYLATASNATAENERQKNLAELHVIEGLATEWIAPYARTFGGMSVKSAIDSFKGEKDNELAKYYAGLALQTEIGALRTKVMGGSLGHESLKDLVKSSFGKARVTEAQVGPKIYKLMNHYMSQALKEGSKAATKSLYGRGEIDRAINGKSPEEFNDLDELEAEIAREEAKAKNDGK